MTHNQTNKNPIFMTTPRPPGDPGVSYLASAGGWRAEISSERAVLGGRGDAGAEGDVLVGAEETGRYTGRYRAACGPIRRFRSGFAGDGACYGGSGRCCEAAAGPEAVAVGVPAAAGAQGAAGGL